MGLGTMGAPHRVGQDRPSPHHLPEEGNRPMLGCDVGLWVDLAG